MRRWSFSWTPGWSRTWRGMANWRAWSMRLGNWSHGINSGRRAPPRCTRRVVNNLRWSPNLQTLLSTWGMSSNSKGNCSASAASKASKQAASSSESLRVKALEAGSFIAAKQAASLSLLFKAAATAGSDEGSKVFRAAKPAASSSLSFKAAATAGSGASAMVGGTKYKETKGITRKAATKIEMAIQVPPPKRTGFHDRMKPWLFVSAPRFWRELGISLPQHWK